MHKRYHWPPRTKRNAVSLLSNRPYYDIETLIRNRMKAAPQFIQRLDLDTRLKGHTGCVNCLEWSANGRLLASGSDDNHVIIWDPFKSKTKLDFLTPHQGNIFSVKFLPNSDDTLIATGAADHCIYVFDITRLSEPASPYWKCCCHSQRVKRLATTAENANIFWSSGEDGRILQFDLREPHNCRQADKVRLIDLQNHIGPNAEAKCVAINQRRPEQLAVGASDAYARVYDRRMIKLAQIDSISLSQSERQLGDNLSRECVTYYCPYHLNKFKDRTSGYTTKTITYLTFSPDGNELLVNMGSEQIYLYDLNNAQQPAYLTIPQLGKTSEIYENSDSNDIEMSATLNEASVSSSSSSAYTKASKLPANVEEMKRAGNDFMENEKYLQAINQYTECINVIPNHPIFYLNRATAYMRRNWFGDVYAALRDCQQALRLDPTYVKAHFRMARALFELGYVIEASECLDELKKRFPNDANNKQIHLLTQDIQSHVDHNDSGASDGPSPELSDNEIYWRTLAKDYTERFVGHCNITTDIKEVNYFGSDGMYVIAGSDEGNFYVWERPTNKIVGVFKGDSSILNCVQPHPYFCLLATSGIDHTISMWCPKPEESDESEHRVQYFDQAVGTNQQIMQADPFEIHTSGAVCRTS